MVRGTSRGPTRSRVAAGLTTCVAVALLAPAARSDAGERVYVTAAALDVRAAASAKSPRVGVVRAGGSAAVDPTRAASAGDGCATPWVPVAPAGFVCAGEGTTRDATSPAVRVLARWARGTSGPLPASYGFATESPLYARVPTKGEQRASEPGLAALQKKLAPEAVDSAPSGEAMPDELRAGAFAPYAPRPVAAGSPVVGVVSGGAPIGWVGEVDADGRVWLVTPDLLLVPRERVRRAVVSAFHGTEISGAARFAIVHGKRRAPYHQEGGAFRAGEPSWAPGTVVTLSDKRVRVGGDVFVETTEPGAFLRASDAIEVTPRAAASYGLGAAERFVDVDARTHAVLLREGDRVVYATLGAVGPDTARGKFRVASKHRTLAAPFDVAVPLGRARAETPLVVLGATAGSDRRIALEASWWLTNFGATKGTPGVGLSPLDARRVFDWAAPALPDGWHSVWGEGAFIVVHD